jgi:copper chaperone CopZ
MASIIGGALFFGILVNELLPRAWFTSHMVHLHDGHGAHLIPQWLKIASSVVLVLLLINGYVQKHLAGKRINESKNAVAEIENGMTEKTIKVSGMTCNHCKSNVQNNLSGIDGIENIEVDLESGKVRMTGETIDLAEVKNKVESIGYHYDGEIKK